MAVVGVTLRKERGERSDEHMFIGHLRISNTIQMFLYKDSCYVCPVSPKKHMSWYHYQSSPMAERYIFGANKGKNTEVQWPFISDVLSGWKCEKNISIGVAYVSCTRCLRSGSLNDRHESARE